MAAATPRLRVTLVRSGIGRPQRHRETLRGLGLRRLGRTVVLRDTAAIRGMITRVQHLVEVERVRDES